jgi:DedD protein
LTNVNRSLSLRAPSKSEVTDPDASTDDVSTPSPQWPEAPPNDAAGAIRQPRYFSRGQFAALGISFLITATLAGVCGLVAGQKIAEKRQSDLRLAASRRPVLEYMTGETSQAELESKTRAADSEPSEGEGVPTKAAAATPLKEVSAATHDGEAPMATVKKNLEASAPAAAKPEPAESKAAAGAAVKKELPAEIWSVQISATQDRAAAQRLHDKLKSKGFDAFIVEADINSIRWYRVRVGRFSTNQEAEKARQDLQSKENLANAFVTGK